MQSERRKNNNFLSKAAYVLNFFLIRGNVLYSRCGKTIVFIPRIYSLKGKRKTSTEVLKWKNK